MQAYLAHFLTEADPNGEKGMCPPPPFWIPNYKLLASCRMLVTVQIHSQYRC